MPLFRRKRKWTLPPVKVEARYDIAPLAESIDWGLSLHKVPDHWKDTEGDGVVVAVLDTGLPDHPDLEISDSKSFASGAYDRNGHSTHICGTIAARRNDMGVVGVAPKATLITGKVLSDSGGGDMGAVAEAIYWAAETADIISMSLGGPAGDKRVLNAIKAAIQRGRYVICAAGNEGRDDSVNYPAKWEETVAVGAVDRNGQLAKFSSRGSQVDIAAPGQDVMSTWLNGTYAKLSGTSMACPFVAGVVALMVAKHRKVGGLSPVGNQTELLEHLRKTSVDAGVKGKDPAYGWGLISPDSILKSPVQPPQHEQPWIKVVSIGKWGGKEYAVCNR